ncbi:hypothetical protein B4U79_00719, partial [Dinothrombium tinctorium]
MTLTPFESASLPGRENMEPKTRVNSLSSLALAALDPQQSSVENRGRKPMAASVTSFFPDVKTKTSSLPVSNTMSPIIIGIETVNNNSSPERTLPSCSSSVLRSPVKSVQYTQNSDSRSNTNNNSGTRRRGSSQTGAPQPPRRKSRELVPGPIRRASQVLISLTSPGDCISLHGECSRRDSRVVPQVTLFHSCIQRLPMKDFGAEVRASMDVDQFLQQAVLLLDVQETSLEGIVDKMVKK